MTNHDVCDPSGLDVLLFGDETSDEYRVRATHVESCDDCQQRLTALAADEDTWNDVSGFLQSCVIGESGIVDHIAPNSVNAHDETPIDVDSLLAPPRHPEMLGRLGRYEIEKVIGSGGMGVVFRGHDSELNRPVAIKTLSPHLANNATARQRFAREGRAAAAVVHEHVVPIHGVESDADVPFLVMHYVAGQSLQARIDESGPLPVREVLRIGSQVAAGLAAAHEQGVVHRDVKPSNILLEKTVERVLLTDFGLARVADDATLTRSGVIAGTPHYMSPEQAKGEVIDHRSDLFSLGSVLYFMTTGHPPFRAEQAMAVLNRISHEPHRPAWDANSDVPDELSDIIDRLLEKNQRARFADATQTHTALARLLSEIQQPGKRRFRSRSRVSRWLHRNRGRVIAGCVALSFATAAGVFFQPSRLNAPKPMAPAKEGAETTATVPGSAVAQKRSLNNVETDDPGARIDEASAEEDFTTNLSEAYEALDRVEHDGNVHLLQDDDQWSREIHDLQNRLTDAEIPFDLHSAPPQP